MANMLVDGGVVDNRDYNSTVFNVKVPNDSGSAWDDYEITAVDPGIWFFTFTCLICAFMMLVIVPLLVRWKTRQTIVEEQELLKDSPEKQSQCENDPMETSFRNIASFNNESINILRIAIPFTVSGLVSSSLSNVCLALVGIHIGTKAIAAYALVQILVGLTDQFLQGPINSLTTLCSHSVGAGNFFLAGQYVQLAILFYFSMSVPALVFWWKYMAEVVLFLEWGDRETALMAEEFVRVYIWSYLLEGFSLGIWQLLEVADHAFEVTIIRMVGNVVNVVVIATVVSRNGASLIDVGFCYIQTTLFTLLLTLVIAEFNGWLNPFKKGLFRSYSLKNGDAVNLMVVQALPLAFASLLSHAEWAMLTFFASAMGPAEVAAWAIIGNIWEVFYSATSGIGSAAALRVGLHFGSNRPSLAKLAGYKALLLSMIVASFVSIVFFSMQDKIPGYFTVDETLHDMLLEIVPYIGVANFAMQFGMTSWSLIGAQGKYTLATWISFCSSWGVCMPLATLFTFFFHIDLQGLMSAVTIGYVTTGAALSFVLLSSNWKELAKQIQKRNSEAAGGECAPEVAILLSVQSAGSLADV